MHTDEYEISLSREIDVCKKKVHALKKNLTRMEQKFSMTTDAFVARAGQGEIACGNKDFTAWMDDYLALRTWQGTMKQYEELLTLMRI